MIQRYSEIKYEDIGKEVREQETEKSQLELERTRRRNIFRQ